jgi:SAM-dependent methyltransferase
LRAWTIGAAQIRAGEMILDVGCGTGELTRAAKRAVGKTGRVFGIDASPEMIEIAREQATREKLEIEFHLEPIEHLSFADNSISSNRATFPCFRARLKRLKLLGSASHSNFCAARISITASKNFFRSSICIVPSANGC